MPDERPSGRCRAERVPGAPPRASSGPPPSSAAREGVVVGSAARVALATAVVASLLACGDRGSDDRSVATVRDSAGVTIVESSEPLWEGAGRGWRVSDEPSLQIGGVAGPEAYQLDRVEGAVRLDDGRIAVADGGSGRIRLYDSAGRHLRDFGRRGGGPGEFEVLSAVFRFRGDSIAGWDMRVNRLSVFGAAGGSDRTVTARGVRGLAVQLEGAFSDGSFVVSPRLVPSDPSTRPSSRRVTGSYRDTVAYLRLGRDGRLLDTIAEVPGRERVRDPEGPRFDDRSVLFGRDHHATVRHDRFYGGDDEHFEIKVRDPSGALRRVFRWAGRVRRVSGTELAAARRIRRERRRRELTRMAPGRTPDASEPGTVEGDHRGTYPAFDRLLVDDGGIVWTRHPVAPGEEEGPRRWSVFDPEGRWSGQVGTPAGLRVLQIGADYVLGVWEDDLDVQYVRVHALSKPSVPPAEGGPASP